MKRDRLKDLAEAAVDRWLSNRETWMKTIIENVAKTLAPIIADQVKAELVGMLNEDTSRERLERYEHLLFNLRASLQEFAPETEEDAYEELTRVHDEIDSALLAEGYPSTAQIENTHDLPPSNSGPDPLEGGRTPY